ncbi:hypothetical protein FO519_000156 [Halicephalobus sp. NKZ332]|nr:hypothetical protein FO519_000156 [Halicephalobus sp. NKZ332]
MSAALVFTIISVIIAIILAYYNHVRNYWKRKGVPGPPGELFFGNLKELDNREVLNVFKKQEWTKKYGKVYGIMEGSRQLLITSDLDLLQELFVKKFEYFHGRRLHPLIGNVDDHKNKIVNLFNSRGSRWKRLRNVSNSSFNVVNLKLIHPTVQDSINELLVHLEKAVGKEIDAYPYFQELTMDIISRIALGQEESKLFNNQFLENVKGVFETRVVSYPEYIAFMFPFVVQPLRALVFFLKVTAAGYIQKVRANLRKVVDARKTQRNQNSKDIQFNDGEKKKVDYIDLFLDLESEPFTDDGSTLLDKHHLKVDKKLTTDEVVSMCQVFLLAGYDTTATSIAYVIHNLATYPEVQKKLQTEIDEYGVSEEPSYDEIQKLKYLDAVVKESLRLHPLAARASARECMESTTLGDINVDKGVQVVADVFSIHYSKEIWGPDAHVFNPDRWLTEEKRHPMAWIPFGAGPRTCVGMRLAYLEEKNFLISCLKKFNIFKTKNTPEKLKLCGALVIAPENIKVRFELRE